MSEQRRFEVPYTARGSSDGRLRLWAEDVEGARRAATEFFDRKTRLYLSNPGRTISRLHYLRKRERAAMQIRIGEPREVTQ